MSNEQLTVGDFLRLIDAIKVDDISISAECTQRVSNCIGWDGKTFTESYVEDFELDINMFELTFKITDMPLRVIKSTFEMSVTLESSEYGSVDEGSISLGCEYTLGGNPAHFMGFVNEECLKMITERSYDASKIILYRRIKQNKAILDFIIEKANELISHCACN